jgi:hypothetical protein
MKRIVFLAVSLISLVSCASAQQGGDGIYINKRPMLDYGNEVTEKTRSNPQILNKPFKVVISGILGLGADGKTIVLKRPRVIRSKDDPQTDPELEKLVQSGILAIADAGWFGYLEKIGLEEVTVSVEQDPTKFVATVWSDQPDEALAKSAASRMSSILAIATSMETTDIETRTLLKAMDAKADGKTFILKFEIQRSVVRDLILRKLPPTTSPK